MAERRRGDLSRRDGRPASKRQLADGGVRAHLRYCQRGSYSRGAIDAYLDLKQVIAADALVVHLIISIFSVTAIFVLNECKSVGV